MIRNLEKYQSFFEHPISLSARTVMVAAALVLIWAFVAPLWTMSFTSNQYPDPLRLTIHIDHLEGQKTPGRDDLREINSLNHYIGMRPLLESEFPEFRWLPFALGFFVLIIARALFFGKLRDLIDIVVLYAYFSLFSLWDFGRRLYEYGHNLNPEAPIKVEPFTPPLYGRVKIANFWIESYPGGASYALGVFGLLLVVALIIALGHARRIERELAEGEAAG